MIIKIRFYNYIYLMEEKCNYLFVYGTLLAHGNEFAAYLKQHCYFYSTGKFKGRLYDIGEYPGAISADTDQFVHGSIFVINDLDEVFTKLDDYEGFGYDQPQPNEFVRELINIETNQEKLKCWVYLYNLPTKGLWQIDSGDYSQYMKFKF